MPQKHERANSLSAAASGVVNAIAILLSELRAQGHEGNSSSQFFLPAQVMHSEAHEGIRTRAMRMHELSEQGGTLDDVCALLEQEAADLADVMAPYAPRLVIAILEVQIKRYAGQEIAVKLEAVKDDILADLMESEDFKIQHATVPPSE